MRAGMIVLVLGAMVFAQDDKRSLPANHPATARWNDARDTYQVAMESARVALLKFLQGVEDKARTDGDIEKLKQIAAEKVDFEKSGTLPKSVTTVTFTKDSENARTVLTREATTAKAAFLKAGLNDAAAVVEQELVTIVGGNKAPRGIADTAVEWKAKTGNRFVRIQPGVWKELVPGDAERTWIESAHNTEFVELRDEDQTVWMRLYADRADIRKADQKLFGRWDRGQWISAPVVVAPITRKNMVIAIKGTGKDRVIVIAVKCDEDTVGHLRGVIKGTDGDEQPFTFQPVDWKEGTATHEIPYVAPKQGDILELRMDQADKPLASISIDDLSR